jgi:superfamily II DNA or RNA helicase
MNMNKTERQEECIKKWLNNKGCGTIHAVVRFGKTRIAKEIIRRFRIRHKDDLIVILVPNEITRKNIKDNIQFDDNILLLTLNQFINRSEEKLINCTLLIVDEIHRFLNGASWHYLQNTTSKFKLGLSGTIKEEDAAKLNTINFNIVDEISEKEAIENSYISKFYEYNLAVELTDSEKKEYSKYTSLISESLTIIRGIYKKINILLKNEVFKSDFDLLMSCFLGKSYRDYYVNEDVKKYKPTDIRDLIAYTQGWNKDLDLSYPANQKINNDFNPANLYDRAKAFIKYIQYRNEIIACNQNKIQATLDIISAYKTQTIIFNESINMVEELHNILKDTSISYHSGLKSRYLINPKTKDYFTDKKGEPVKIGVAKLKTIAIEGLKSGVYSELICAKALNEGLNIENIERVITTGGSCNPVTHSQRTGRGKTVDYTNPDKVCIIINIYVDDFELDGKTILSRDKEKLKLRQKNSININFIKNISEINSKYLTQI